MGGSGGEQAAPAKGTCQNLEYTLALGQAA